MPGGKRSWAGEKRTSTGEKARPNSLPYSPFIIQLVRCVHFTHHLVSELTAHIASRQHGYLHIPVRSWICRVHSGSVQFSSRYLPCCRPRLRRGGVVVHQAASARLSVRSVASVCGRGAHIQHGHPAVVFHMVLCMFSRIAFLHLLRVPCSTGQSCLIQGCDNLRLFQVSGRSLLLSAATSRACEKPMAVSSVVQRDCVTCDHTRGSERRGCCMQCRN